MTEKIEGVVQAFTTTDFDFCAYAMTLRNDAGKPKCILEAIMPYERNPRTAGHGHRFTFCLLPNEGDTIEWLEQAQMAYTNRTVRVEPIDFMAQRQQLRVLLDAAVRRINNAGGR